MSKQRCINRELTTEVVVGAFMMTVLLGLGYFTIILSRESWFVEKPTIEILFQHVMGLSVGDAVVCRGMPVGKVQSLDIREDGVHVAARLDKPIALREDYAISIVTVSILGGRHLEIEIGSPAAAELGPQTLYTGKTPHDLMSDATDVVSVLRRTLIDEGAMENLEIATRELRIVVERVARGEGTLGKLLSPDSSLFDDLRASVGSLREMTARLENGEGMIGKLMSTDATMYDDFAAAAASLRQIVQRLEKGESSLGRLMADDSGLYQDLAATVASLKEVAARIEKGQGLIGKLTTDDELYDEIKDTVTELKAGIEDFRETSPVTTFTSIFFGAL